MDFRPCPRCGKLVPDEALFCRRCGNGLRPGYVRGRATPPPADGSGVRGFCFASFAAGVGALLAMVAVSGRPRTWRCESAPVTWGDRPAWEQSTSFPRVRPGLDPSHHDDVDGAGNATEFGGPPPLPAAARGPSPAPAPETDSPPSPAAAVAPAGGPRITGATPRRAGPGDVVVLTGAGLEHASRVLFIGRRDAARASAAFVVRDDAHVAAVVPRMGPRSQELALAVVSPAGVAVTVPGDATPVDAAVEQTDRGGVLVVGPGGVFHGGDAAVLVVDPGGFAGAGAARTLFARRGSRLWGRAAAGAMVFCEHGVLEDSNVFATREVVEVDSINPCPVQALVEYSGRGPLQ